MLLLYNFCYCYQYTMSRCARAYSSLCIYCSKYLLSSLAWMCYFLCGGGSGGGGFVFLEECER